MSKAKTISEKEFTAQVIQFARLHGWISAHFRPGMNRRGEWSTAVQGDGVGFPDLLLCRGPGREGDILVAELKVGKNKLTPEQITWRTAFQRANVPSYVWTPDDWPEIQRVLEN